MLTSGEVLALGLRGDAMRKGGRHSGGSGDRALQSAANFLQRTDVPSYQYGDVEGARKALRGNTRLISGRPLAVDSVRDDILGGTDTELRVPVRIYSHGQRAPGLVYFHGGGFVVGDLDTVDPLCRRLALACACTVVSVHYRRAPENPFPAAIEDAAVVLRSIAQGDVHECERNRVAVAGDSAGGNIATVASRIAIDAGVDIRFQALIYPVVDFRDDARPSRELYAAGYGLDADLLDWYRACYLPASSDWSDPAASPLLGQLAGHAPALIMTAECDAVRDQGEEYARALSSDGVPVVGLRSVGELHGFIRAFEVTPAASWGVAMIATASRLWP